MGRREGGAELKGEEGSRFLFPQDLHSVLHSCKVQVRSQRSMRVRFFICCQKSLCVGSEHPKSPVYLIFSVSIVHFINSKIFSSISDFMRALPVLAEQGVVFVGFICMKQCIGISCDSSAGRIFKACSSHRGRSSALQRDLKHKQLSLKSKRPKFRV